MCSLTVVSHIVLSLSVMKVIGQSFGTVLFPAKKISLAEVERNLLCN